MSVNKNIIAESEPRQSLYDSFSAVNKQAGKSNTKTARFDLSVKDTGSVKSYLYKLLLHWRQAITLDVASSIPCTAFISKLRYPVVLSICDYSSLLIPHRLTDPATETFGLWNFAFK